MFVNGMKRFAVGAEMVIKKPPARYRWLHKLWYTFAIADAVTIGGQARECLRTARAFCFRSFTC